MAQLTALLVIRLVFGEQLIGALSVRMTGNREVDQEDFDFAQSLAQQATLAIELARLAEQAKQAALAREERNKGRVQLRLIVAHPPSNNSSGLTLKTPKSSLLFRVAPRHCII
jgi:GAF domain-containing protein